MSASRQLQFAAEGFAVPAKLRVHAQAKAVALLRLLHSRSGMVRLQMKHENLRGNRDRFAVCGRVEHTSADHVAHTIAGDPVAAIDATFEKLERVLTAAAGIRKDGARRSRRGRHT